MVVVECTSGRPGRDVGTNRFLKTCEIVTELDEATARRAAQLRHRARRGSVVDAVVVAIAEPGGCALTGDETDLGALAAHATGVTIQTV